MIVNLFRSGKYEAERFWDVVNLLRTFPGPLQFVTNENPIIIEDDEIYYRIVDEEEFYKSKNFVSEDCNDLVPPPKIVSTLTWKEIFKKCSSYRKKNRFGDEEFCVLLTEIGNDRNWFSAGDPSGERNLFVHTAYWEYFIGSDQRYPIAYHIASGILKKLLFKDYDDLEKYWHQEPIGCMMDFCRSKKQISLKLRTGDICESCQDLISKRKVDQRVVMQVFSIFDGIRTQMAYKSRFNFNPTPPELHIYGNNRKFKFPELGDLEVNLNPLEKTVYLFFLSKPEGVQLSHVQDYKNEIFEIYSRVSNSGSQESIQSRIDDLVDPSSNSISEKISKIRKKFNEALGEEIAKLFVITGENASKKKINVDRTRVVYHY